jgi:KDO2-lipid IV(A) lauroyltransferase
MSIREFTSRASRRTAVFFLDAAIAAAGRFAYCFFDLAGWRFISWAGRIFGGCMYRLRPGRRRTIEAAYGLFFSGQASALPASVMARRSFDNYYKRHIETFFFGRLTGRDLDRIVEARGIEHVDAALTRGRGAILLLAHFGSFLLPLPFLGHRGYRVNQVTGRQRHGSLPAERFWEWRRREAAKLPVQFIQVGAFLRPLYAALKRNELAAIAFDGRDGAVWETVNFFGLPVRFSPGPFDLARRTGAAIIPTFMIRRPDDTHTLVFEPQFRLSGEPDARAAARTDTRNFAAVFEGYVRRHPCHFGMLLPALAADPDPGPGPLPGRKGTP